MPPGIGGTPRRIQVRAVDQTSPLNNNIAIKYYKPSVVDIVRPLWRPSRGGWDIEILGFNFGTESYMVSQTSVTNWKHTLHCKINIVYKNCVLWMK